MTQYRVTWEIDVDADTPEEAARKARAYQIKPGTTALVFDVGERHEGGSADFYFQLVASVDLHERTLITPDGEVTRL